MLSLQTKAIFFLYYLASLPSLYIAFVHQWWNFNKKFSIEHVVVYQYRIDKLYIPFKAHWSHLLFVPKCSLWCCSHSNILDILTCLLCIMNQIFSLSHFLRLSILMQEYLISLIVLRMINRRPNVLLQVLIIPTNKQLDWPWALNI